MARLRKIFLSLFLLSFVASCSSLKKSSRIYKTPEVETENLYRDVESTDSTSFANVPWQQVFQDKVLQNLINEGLSNNIDLQIVINRIKAAEARYGVAKMSLLPPLSLNASASETKLTDADAAGAGDDTQEQYDVSLSTSWELDIWGKLRSAKKAEYAALLESDAYKRAVQTRLIANVSNYYYSLLALDYKLAILEETVQNRIKSVETMGSLKDAGIVTGAAVVQSEASRYAAEIVIPDVQQQIREIENALSVLLGRNPGPIERTTFDDQNIPDYFETGIPSLLLSNRPDVQQAEYALRGAFEGTKQARTYFYPALTISASAGYSNVKLDDLFRPGSVFANVAAGLFQPIFNNGTNKARLEIAKVAQEEALLNFYQTILTAGQEVSNALFAYDTAEKKAIIREQQLKSLNNSVDFTKELLNSGKSNYLDVLTSEQSLLSAQLNSIDDTLMKYQAVVNLYTALGGGW